MKRLKKIVLIIGCLIVIIVFPLGIYDIFKSYFTIQTIKAEGVEAIGTIQAKWRGKCGSGYGNSASFVVEIGGKKRKFISDCNVPNEVKVGDKYYVKFLAEDPSKNLVLFDRKVFE